MRLGLGAAEAPSRLRLGLELADGDATEDDHERHPRGDRLSGEATVARKVWTVITKVRLVSTKRRP